MDAAPLHGDVFWTDEVVADYRIHGNNLHGSLCEISDSALLRVLHHYDLRSRFLDRACVEAGHAVRANRWRERNWRLQLVETLLGDVRPAQSVRRLLRAVHEGGPPGSRRALLRAVLPVIACTPAPLDRWMASRILNLAHM